jgi:hypothetical protein
MSTHSKILKLFLVTIFTVPALFAVLLLALFAVIGGNAIILTGGGTIIMPAPILTNDAKGVLASLGQLFVVLIVEFGWMYLFGFVFFCWLFAVINIFRKEILSLCYSISNTRIFLFIRKKRRSL